MLTNPPFSQNYDRKGMSSRSGSLRVHAGDRQEGGPHVRPAHAGRARAGRARRDRHAARRALPRRRGEGDPHRDHRGRPARSGHRPGPEPLLRHRHPRLHPGAARTAPRPAERRGKVLFINADREFTAGRAQNYLGPQHVEKIVTAYHEYADIPGFARVVDIAELRDNDFNLNIRRYVDNTPPPEPQDVRAHLHGGVPEAEVAAHADRFAAYGIDVALFSPNETRLPRLPASGLAEAADKIPALAAPKEEELSEAFEDWWDRHVKHITELPDTGRIMETRPDLLDSFVAALEPLGVLDRYQLAGVIASWWGDVQYDVRTLAFHRFSGVVQGWLTTIEAAFADDEDEVRDKQKRAAEKRKAREHRVVPVLIPDYLTALEEAEARRADLDAQLKAATAAPDETRTTFPRKR